MGRDKEEMLQYQITFIAELDNSSTKLVLNPLQLYQISHS